LEKKLFNLWIFPEWDPGALPLEKKNISKNDNKMLFFENHIVSGLWKLYRLLSKHLISLRFIKIQKNIFLFSS
jgi:hypothetical protein